MQQEKSNAVVTPTPLIHRQPSGMKYWLFIWTSEKGSHTALQESLVSKILHCAATVAGCNPKNSAVFWTIVKYYQLCRVILPDFYFTWKPGLMLYLAVVDDIQWALLHLLSKVDDWVARYCCQMLQDWKLWGRWHTSYREQSDGKLDEYIPKMSCTIWYLCYEIHGVLGLMLFWDLSSPPIYFLLPQN